MRSGVLVLVCQRFDFVFACEIPGIGFRNGGLNLGDLPCVLIEILRESFLDEERLGAFCAVGEFLEIGQNRLVESERENLGFSCGHRSLFKM